MSALRRRLGPASSERGMSVVELTVAIMLMSIAGAIVGSVLVSTTRATVALEDDTYSVDALRVAMGRIEHDFRSAECVYEPAVTDPDQPATGSTMRFSTRVNAGNHEVTYQIVGGSLERVRDGVVQPLVDDLVETADAFTYAETPRRSVQVRLVVEQADGRSHELATRTIAGRNAWRNC